MYLMIDKSMYCNSTLTIDVLMYAYLLKPACNDPPLSKGGGAHLCNIYDVLTDILGLLPLLTAHMLLVDCEPGHYAFSH